MLSEFVRQAALQTRRVFRVFPSAPAPRINGCKGEALRLRPHILRPGSTSVRNPTVNRGRHDDNGEGDPRPSTEIRVQDEDHRSGRRDKRHRQSPITYGPSDVPPELPLDPKRFPVPYEFTVEVRLFGRKNRRTDAEEDRRLPGLSADGLPRGLARRGAGLDAQAQILVRQAPPTSSP